MGALPRVYICDDNPRMRQIISDRLEGHAEVVGAGGTARGAIGAVTRLEPDVVVLDYRTAVGHLEETVSSIKDRHPSVTVVVHTGVPRSLIQDQVESAGGVYSPKNEPEHLIALVHSLRTAPMAKQPVAAHDLPEAASQGS
jgi:chemotaxis response regulator CheB